MRLEIREAGVSRLSWALRGGGSTSLPRELPRSWARRFRAYLAGDLGALEGCPKDLGGITPFQQRILAALARVGPGRRATYGEIARAAGSPAAARAAGQAIKRNPVPLLLPCHRVGPSGGALGNYAPGPALKRRLLEHEESHEGIHLDPPSAHTRITGEHVRRWPFPA
jgi:methylated-DNA-[protein]-cysteine S-methyltransferase